MPRRPVCCVALLALFALASLAAQQAPPTTTPTGPARKISEPEQAFRDALKVKPPDERLRAFQRIREKYPDFAAKTPAVALNIVTGLCNVSAPLLADARRTAAAWLAAASGEGTDAVAWNAFLLANHFYRTGMWTDAETYARKALATWEQRPRSEAAMQFGQPLRRVAVVAMLGASLFEQDRPAEARTVLEEAYAGRADEPGLVGEVVPKLVALARRENRRAEEVEYLATLALYGGLTPEDRKALDAAWAAGHGGRPDGLEEMLDARYAEEYPKTIPAGSWKRPEGSHGRTVLLEGFSGTSCAACVGIDLALDATLRRYSRSDVILLTYHGHVPAPDPLVNPSSETRLKRYGIEGLPAIAIDGVLPKEQGGGRAVEAAGILRERLQPALEHRLTLAPLAQLQLEAALSKGVVRAKVRVGGVKSPGPDLRLHVALVEERVRFSGTNGVRFHPMVVRQLANGGQGLRVAKGSVDCAFDLAAVTRQNKQYLDTFEKDNKTFGPITFAAKQHQMDWANLAVVAFLQNATTNEVLQAAWTKIVP